MNINAVDLFCGVGGLTHGLEQTGINVVAGIDIEEKCRFPYEQNNHAKFIQGDLKEISSKTIEDLYPTNTDIKMLAGCAPCQPFSSYSYRYKGTDASINKLDLLDTFGRIVKDILPDIVSMENVPQLAKEPIFDKFIAMLDSLNYKIHWHIVFAPKYGVPQKRKRLVLLASRVAEVDLIPPIFDENNYPTVRETIGTLPHIKSGAICLTDSMHKSVKLSALNLRRIKQSVPGGTWHDWDDDLLLEAYKKKSGQSYTAVYGRMKWDEPAPTITTKFYGYGNGRFGHPEQNRALSYREGSMLQTFPQEYIFFDNKHPISTRELGVMIGNAVPVKLGAVIGKSILQRIGESTHGNQF
ncbi:DNA cytosine methyltransferase [Lactiplantibacillus plantarum]|uniref:DNA cytosine methyltransferase n=1 Tax=Lactiplantibacillus plantarum TaxID=1590 RepID=UPI001BA8D95D|nr:DNA cytosine methyltransferase [Lactiplantibacillus plantarum]MBS0951666.1 DNA cytosine methyltransferase [Lactiplantibacillus plantarum]MDN7040377.1 DNA cytosine methyltransferase [Lactiplantibacillus plantarum]